MKILITLKSIEHLEKLGGVGTFYKVLRSHFTNDIEYLNFSDDNDSKIIGKIIFRVRDTLKFLKLCFAKNNTPKLIHLNPSFSWSSILRDGILLLIADWSGKKTIVFFHGWHSYMVNIIDGNILISSMFKWVYKRADAFIVLSKDFKEKLREWGFKQKIYIETTLVDDALLNGHPVNENIIIDHKTFNILFLARVEKAKGIYEVIDAYEKLKLKYPQVKLTIAGDGSQLDEIKKIVVERIIEDIEFTGYLTGEEKARVFARSDVYLFPTHGEGMPLSVLEAMAFGLPVITRPVGGLKDFFEHGEMGFMTESKDPEVFADFIEQLILDQELRHKMSRYNAEFARKHFLASVVAKRLESIYSDVINNTHRKEYSWLS